MAQLREFAQHEKDFEASKTRVVAISVDNQDLGRQTWEKAVEKKFTILSDPTAATAKAYGVFESGEGGKPGNKRALVLVDEQGMERWQEPAGMMTAQEVLKRIQVTQ